MNKNAQICHKIYKCSFIWFKIQKNILFCQPLFTVMYYPSRFQKSLKKRFKKMNKNALIYFNM